MRIFEPKTDEVTGDWRRLHNEALYVLYSLTKYHSGDQIKEMGRACSMYGERKGAYRVSVGKTRGKGIAWKTQA